MANRFESPFEQFADSTGLPYAGGSLSFYASGTSTPLNTYNDPDLAVPHANSNPVVLDSAGRPAVAIFLQNLAYKVVLADSAGVPIWTADPVYTSDYSTAAQFLTNAGNPNGSVAGTAGSGAVLSSSIWDRTNNILYICTTTGTASTAVWTAVNAASQAATPPPQGYLTPTSGTAIITGDVVSATAVYYTPYVGNVVPVWNGISFTLATFSELTLTLAAQHLANNIYDVFAFLNSGVVTLATGPAWSVATAGSGARGTGASTTQLTRLQGLWVNAVSMNGRNGATTYSAIGANQATYVGSLLIDGSNGQVSCYRSWGQSRVFAVWNAYNRAQIVLRVGDSTASWSYNTNSYRASNNDSNNRARVFCGLAEEQTTVLFNQSTQQATNTGLGIYIGVGLNSTTVLSGFSGFWKPTALTFNNMNTATFTNVPALGLNNFQCLEQGGNTTTSTFSGTETSMVLEARYRG